MRGQASSFGYAACALLVSLATTARAVDPPANPGAAVPAADSEQRKTEAKERFLRGLALAQESNWDAALAEFLASRELFPTRVALRNAALSLRNLKRYHEALEMYAELVARFADQFTADEKKQVDDAMAELRNFVGEIDIESSERDCVVVVDGQQRGATPLPAPVTVDVGTHSVHLSKEGFEPFDSQLVIAGKQRKTLSATLKPLSSAGRLTVQEADGNVLDVLVDGAAVGKTPWSGALGVGVHSVALRGAGDVGSAPATANIVKNGTATLTLVSTKLDAEVRVEPVPATAHVDLDGVDVGAGVWQGKLPSGAHRVEVAAEGHVPFRREVTLRHGQREVVRVELERDLSNPMWRAGFVPHVYLELDVGPAIAPSLGGGADAACGHGDCSTRSRPFGASGALRGGYLLNSGLGMEVMLGAVTLSESMTRSVTATLDNQTGYTSKDVHDSTKLTGGLAALGVSFHLFEKTPLVFRLSAGVARATVTPQTHGTFSDPMGNLHAVTVDEKIQHLWLPLLSPEIRFGYRLGKRFTLDIGVAAQVFFGPASTRQSTTFSSDGQRHVLLPNLGLLKLPSEDSVGTIFTIVPTIGGRFDL